MGLTASAVSHAALFDDTEARKRILELETRQVADRESQQTVINDLSKTQKALEKRIQSLEGLINGKGLLDMQNQLAVLNQDVAQLKGDLEVVAHKLDELTRKQSEQYADLDTRLRRLETAGAPAPVNGQPAGAAVPAEADVKATEAAQQESRAYAEAESFSQAGKYKEAFNAYDAFLKTYSGSKLVPDAMYGMGYSQFALKNYKSAAATQQKFLEHYSAHTLAPQAMFNLANSQIQLGQIPAAKKVLKELIATYPSSDVAPSAEKRLKVLESIK